MSYITSALLYERVETTRLNNLLRTSDSGERASIISNVIDRSDGVIDGYASTRYDIPLPVIPLVEEWALTIAEYELYKRGSGPVPDKIRTSYEDTISALKDLSKGFITIPDDTATTNDEAGSNIKVESDTSYFSETNMSVF